MKQEVKEESHHHHMRHSSEVYEMLASSAIMERQQLSLQQLYCDSSKVISVVLRTQDVSLFSDDFPDDSTQNFEDNISNQQNHLKKSTQFNLPTKTNNESLNKEEEDDQTVKNTITPHQKDQLTDAISPHSDSVLTNSGSFQDDSMNSEYSRQSKVVSICSVQQSRSSTIPEINIQKPALFKAGLVIKEVMRSEQPDEIFKKQGGHFDLLKNEFQIHEIIGNHRNILKVLNFNEHINGAYAVMPWAKFGDCDLFIQWQLFNMQKLQHSVADMRNLMAETINFFIHPKKLEELEDKRMELHSYIQNTLIKGSLEPCIFALRSMTKQIGQALYFLHEKHGIAHNDIKPDNFYIKSKRTTKSNYLFQLADFGYASRVPFETQQQALEFFSRKSTRFFSPELHQLISKKYNNNLLPMIDCKKVDIFALGLSIFQILTGGFFPFKDDPNDIQLKKFIDGELTVNILLQSFSPYFSQVTPYNDFLDLLSHMLDPNPQTRFDIKQVLSHPWLKNFKSKHHFPQKNAQETKEMIKQHEHINKTTAHNNNPNPIIQTITQQQLSTVAM